MILSSVGGIIIENMGWRACYWVWAGMCLVLMPLAWLVIRQQPSDMNLEPIGTAQKKMADELLNVNKGIPASKAFKTWPVYLLMLSCGLNAMAANVSPYISSYVQSLGHGAALAGIIGGLTSAGRMVYKFLTGAAWDKKPQWAVLLYTCSTLLAYGVLFVTKGSSLPVVV